MPENCTRAFGRYLRTLRERRGLSLDEVYSLSQTFPERINKGYLSRCENGHQKLAFSKVVPLSRIYGVPADVLTERMELDMELDRVGGPETEGLTYAELVEACRSELDKGAYLKAYAFAREATHRSAIDPVQPRFKDRTEQIAISFMGCGTAARGLGQHRYALHEYLYIESTGSLGSKFHSLILERISSCYWSLKKIDLADEYAELAITRAEGVSDDEYLAYIYGNKALIAFAKSDFSAAVSLYGKSYRVLKKQGRIAECARSLNNLGQCYFEMKRYGAARRACEASARLSTANGYNRARALGLLLLGELDELDSNDPVAAARWKTAATIARELDDKELRFKAELLLFRRALRKGEDAAARSIRRRLRRLAAWMTPTMPELEEFKQLSS